MPARETSKFRELLAGFCLGDGVDIGFGTDPIVETAIRIDDTSSWLPPYEHSVEYRQMTGLQLKGDARSLKWFTDGCMDYVYSSHTLEDFEDKEMVLKEWVRILKPGGHLVLLLPDEQCYRQFEKNLNPLHKDENFCLETAVNLVRGLGLYIVRTWNFLPHDDGDYNFALVAMR